MMEAPAENPAPTAATGPAAAAAVEAQRETALSAATSRYDDLLVALNEHDAQEPVFSEARSYTKDLESWLAHYESLNERLSRASAAIARNTPTAASDSKVDFEAFEERISERLAAQRRGIVAETQAVTAFIHNARQASDAPDVGDQLIAEGDGGPKRALLLRAMQHMRVQFTADEASADVKDPMRHVVGDITHPTRHRHRGQSNLLTANYHKSVEAWIATLHADDCPKISKRTGYGKPGGDYVNESAGVDSRVTLADATDELMRTIQRPAPSLRRGTDMFGEDAINDVMHMSSLTRRAVRAFAGGMRQSMVGQSREWSSAAAAVQYAALGREAFGNEAEAKARREKLSVLAINARYMKLVHKAFAPNRMRIDKVATANGVGPDEAAMLVFPYYLHDRINQELYVAHLFLQVMLSLQRRQPPVSDKGISRAYVMMLLVRQRHNIIILKADHFMYRSEALKDGSKQAKQIDRLFGLKPPPESVRA